MTDESRCVDGCPLPLHCTTCKACLMHCAGCTSWWKAALYFVRVWWSLRSWSTATVKQGGWYVQF